MNSRVVPARPSLEQYRKQAKELLEGIANQIPAALSRACAHHPRLSGLAASEVPVASIKLTDAHLVIAREHGFESWPRFAAHLREVLRVPPDTFGEKLRVGNIELTLEVTGRRAAHALVLFALAGNVGRYHPGIRETAAAFNRASFCTVLADLLTEEEDIQDAVHETLRYDIPLLASRMQAVIDRFAGDVAFNALPVGVFGSGTGAAAGVAAVSRRATAVRAVVCSAGRPDLAGSALAYMSVPTLFVFGGDDTVGYGFMRTLIGVLPPQVPRRLDVLDGAADRFDAHEHVARAAELATVWFADHLRRDVAATRVRP